jgi:phage protein U
MSGPVSMMLGAFAFESLGFGYQDVGRKVDTPWADIPVAATLNQQQWTGPTSDEVTIKGVLFPVEFGGQSSLNGLIAAQNAGTPLMFVSGDAGEGIIRGMFTIQSISEDRSFHDQRGRPLKNAYQITLKRYGAASAGGSLMGSLGNLLW